MLMVQLNPFIIEGYLSPEYFCDRVEETTLLTRHLTNRCNVALIAPRRLGKSGLIYNCFQQENIREQYHCIYIDIYDTKNLNEFVYALGKGILTALKPKGRKVWEFFLNTLLSLKSTISFDINGNPEWSVGLGDIQVPNITLDEIFAYLEQADKPCLVAIDEFQTVANYPEKTVEATLRKRIQNCHNANFVFSGSKRHMMALMFTFPSHARSIIVRVSWGWRQSMSRLTWLLPIIIFPKITRRLVLRLLLIYIIVSMVLHGTSSMFSICFILSSPTSRCWKKMMLSLRLMAYLPSIALPIKR